MDRALRALAGFLGVVFVGLGVAEVARAVRSGDGGLAFWFLSLCGGGALVLTGAFLVAHRRWLSFGCITVGTLAASLATAWTLVLPVLGLVLIALAFWRAVPAGRCFAPTRPLCLRGAGAAQLVALGLRQRARRRTPGKLVAVTGD